MLSYRAFAASQGRLLVHCWHRTAACEARYSELFKPLEGCVVVDELSQLASLGYPMHLLSNDVVVPTAFTHPEIEGTPLETTMWHELQPTAALRAAAEANVHECGPHFVAVHVRRTDHHVYHEACRTTDAQFSEFLERHAPAPIYMATDNAVSQQDYQARYGDRVKALTPMELQPVVDVHRHTSVQQAVIDIFTCMRATVFKGSYYSSFSDAIQRLRLAHGLASEADEHDMTIPEWHAALAGASADLSIALDDPALLEYFEKLESGKLNEAHLAREHYLAVRAQRRRGHGLEAAETCAPV